MKPDVFKNLSDSLAKQGFELCSDNAWLHFSIACDIAKEKNYALANSHLILAAEEAIKALILCYKHQLKGFTMDVRDLFTDHRSRHKLARENFEFYHAQFVGLLEQLVRHETHNYELLEDKESDEGKYLQSNITFYTIKADQIRNYNPVIRKKEIDKWFKGADKAKESGFYVDLINNSWRSTLSFTLEEYEKSKFLSFIFVGLVYLTKLYGGYSLSAGHLLVNYSIRSAYNGIMASIQNMSDDE